MKNFNPKDPVICPNCQDVVDKSDITTYKGELMCEGCAETRDMLEDHDDPHGRNWGNE